MYPVHHAGAGEGRVGAQTTSNAYCFLSPPLPEQHRIVVRTDALMALCDQLEARLKQQQERAALWGASTVHGLLAG